MEEVWKLLDALGLTISQAILVAMLALAYIVGCWMPLWFPIAVAIRRRATLRRPVVFVGFAYCAISGAFLLVGTAAVLPINAFVVYVLPSLRRAGYMEESAVLGMFEFMFSWWWIGLPFASALLSILVVNFLSHRWSRLVEAFG